MSSHPSRPPAAGAQAVALAQVQALRRVALAVVHPGGPHLFAHLVRELAASLQVGMVFVAVFAAGSRNVMRTLAACLDGCVLREFDYPLEGSPCAVVGQSCQFIESGLLERLEPGSLFERERMDSFAAFPLNDSTGEPLGLVVAMDRQPIAGGDGDHAEAMLEIIAGRAAAEIERERTDRVQQQALQELRLREEQYRAIFEGSLDGLFMWNEHLRIVDVNPAGLALYGYRREDIVGRTYPSNMPQDYVRERLQMVRRAIAGETTHLETTVLRPDGTSFDADLRVMPFTQRGHRHALAVVRDISERRRRERELQRSEARLRATVEAAFDCVIGMDSEGRIVEFNAAAERVFGHRREDVLGRHLVQVMLPKRHHAAYYREMMNLRAHGSGPMVGKLVETKMLHADGREIQVELAMSVAAVPEGNIFVGHLRDITERRRADQALRDSEEQYRAIFNASVDALVLRDASFRIVDVNATYEAMSGYSHAEVVGLDRVLANPPEVSATIRALHEKAIAGATVTLETVLLRRDGKRYDLELRGVPIQHRGQPHVLYMGRDITQGKRAERALRDSEEQYRAIFNASADALVLRDASYRAVEVNPAYTTMSGFSREEVMASPRVLTQADEALRARHRAEHELALLGKELRFEVTATRKDGSTLQAEVRATPMMYRGEPHVLYAVRDITERIAAEQRRAELERQLRQAQKMEAIGQLTGGLAHDFNNILTSVLGYVAMAQERPAALADPVLERQLGQARLAAERARDHVAQLLAFSRPRRGERRLLGPAAVARQALQLLRPNLPSSIVVECPELCDGPEPVVPPVVADPVQFEQVLFNLCINARDAIHDHGTIRVRLGHSGAAGRCASCGACLDDTSWVWVEVADDGRGMPQEVVERMFEPFFTTKEVGRGTGMGLAMVHGIVHDHDGHIQATSRLGQGSVFRVLLPPAAQDTRQADAPAAPAPPAVRAPPLQGRVLLVEDEAIVSGYMLELLTGWGLEVVLERDPRAAARRLAAIGEPFDLLLTDQTMPGMTGLALSRHATQHRPGLPVLLYTGNASEIGQAELADCGVSALLRKPIDGATLRPLLRDLLLGPRPQISLPDCAYERDTKS
jgi:PAS domain S-box-containing protein